jgi:hypothetical protein
MSPALALSGWWAAAIGMVALSRGAWGGSVPVFLGLVVIGSASAWLLSRRMAWSRTTVMGFALAAHALAAFGQPLYEDDHFRYLWDGYRTAVSGSPYGLAPAAFYDDATVPPDMAAVLSSVNHADVPTIYGPALQGLFVAGYALGGADERPLRLLLAALHLLLVWRLLGVARPARVLLYVAQPLVFKEVALTGHPDALVALALLLAWQWRAVASPWASAAAYALALAVKSSALPALGAWLLARQWRGMLAVAALLLAMYVPFVGSGSDVAGLRVFAEHWQFNPGLVALLAPVLGWPAAKATMAVLATALMLGLYRRVGEGSPASWVPVFGLLLLVSPVINPWYLLWFLPLAALTPHAWPWWAALAVLFSYATGLNLGREDIDAHAIAPWALAAQWTFVAVGLALSLSGRASRAAAPHSPDPTRR